MEKALVFINEEHKITKEQEKILQNSFDKYDFYKISSNGLTLEEQENLASSFINSDYSHLVFISPIPFLLAKCASISAQRWQQEMSYHDGGYWDGNKYPSVMVFHNDKREKKEINGKIIMTVAKNGWKLVTV